MTIITEQDIVETKNCLAFLTQKIETGSIQFSPENSEIFFAVGQFNKDILKKYIDSTKEQQFWLEREHEWINDWLFENPFLLWYLLKLDCNKNQICIDFIEDLKRNQTIEGKLHSNSITHSGPLRVLTLIEPESITTKNAINYFINNWKDFDIDELSIGILALSEINYFTYEDLIKEICQFLLSQQEKEGYFGEISVFRDTYTLIPFDNTGYAVIALSRFIGPDHDAVKRGIKWMIENKENFCGAIQNYNRRLGLLLLALIAIGGGPKISLSENEWRQMLQKQQIDFMKPYFIHTSPLYDSKIQVRELYEMISENIKLGKERIRICSLFIDMLYEEIINLAEKNPNLEFNIITRPSKEIKGMREKIARNVIQLLSTASKGNLRTNEFLHCRMIIIDENVLIVSSADLTRDQFFDEFNAGIYTRDKESIKKAISFFKNIWEQSDKLST